MKNNQASAISFLDFDRSADTAASPDSPPSLTQAANVSSDSSSMKNFDSSERPLTLQNNTYSSPSERTSPHILSFQNLRGGVANEVVIKKWEGVVERVSEKDAFFVAKLVDTSTESHLPTEIAEFPLSSLSSSDRELLRPGAVFYWIVGSRTLPYGTVENVNRLTFRRLPQWTEKELSIARARAKTIAHAVQWD
ncbi:MAG: hypothetical protein SFV19_08725 [Rhodospirillaceae bacterium]|nr:hypothetical protein [Rhodospirillaceae bacterium]